MKMPPFNPTLAWPEPRAIGPHQTTYGTEPMTCTDNPRQPTPPRPGESFAVFQQRRHNEEVGRLTARISELTEANDRLKVDNTLQADLIRQKIVENADLSMKLEGMAHERNQLRTKITLLHGRFDAPPA